MLCCQKLPQRSTLPVSFAVLMDKAIVLWVTSSSILQDLLSFCRSPSRRYQQVVYILLHSGSFPPPDNLSGGALINKKPTDSISINWTCRLCKTICNCNIWLPVQSVYCFLRITGTCFTFFPTFLRCNAKTISLVRSKKPISFFQLIPHLQCCNPINCCFIFLPHFGQILLLAPMIFTSLKLEL